MQSNQKKIFTPEEWQKKLDNVQVQKPDLNRLVMNYLVTEVNEIGTILSTNPNLCVVST